MSIDHTEISYTTTDPLGGGERDLPRPNPLPLSLLGLGARRLEVSGLAASTARTLTTCPSIWPAKYNKENGLDRKMYPTFHIIS